MLEPKTKGILIIAGAGLLLLSYGTYSYVADIYFVRHALQTKAAIEQVHEETISASNADWFSSGLQSAHECRYNLRFRPRQADADIVSQIKIIKHSGCLHSGMLVSILYDPRNPENISFYTSVDQVVPVGKILMFFGIMNIGLAYFAWVYSDNRKSNKIIPKPK
jgi:hypothetical protein